MALNELKAGTVSYSTSVSGVTVSLISRTERSKVQAWTTFLRVLKEKLIALEIVVFRCKGTTDNRTSCGINQKLETG